MAKKKVYTAAVGEGRYPLDKDYVFKLDALTAKLDRTRPDTIKYLINQEYKKHFKDGK